MVNQWYNIFEGELSLGENIKQAITNISSKPSRFIKIFWLLWLQVCIAVFLLILSMVLPFIMFSLV